MFIEFYDHLINVKHIKFIRCAQSYDTDFIIELHLTGKELITESWGQEYKSRNERFKELKQLLTDD